MEIDFPASLMSVMQKRLGSTARHAEGSRLWCALLYRSRFSTINRPWHPLFTRLWPRNHRLVRREVHKNPFQGPHRTRYGRYISSEARQPLPKVCAHRREQSLVQTWANSVISSHHRYGRDGHVAFRGGPGLTCSADIGYEKTTTQRYALRGRLTSYVYLLSRCVQLSINPDRYSLVCVLRR